MAEYIKRQKVYEMLNALGGCGAEPESWADGWDKAIDTAIDELNKILAADVRPEGHGKWEKSCDRYSYFCSICKEEPDRSGRLLSDFCPWCGAKMDGKENANGQTT